MSYEVDLVVPVKSLHRAKSRLLGAADGGGRDPGAHAALALALALDTLSAAAEAPGVRRVVAVTSDAGVAAAVRDIGVESIPDVPDIGLNEALRHGARVLREADPRARLGALQADLPALRAAELGAAIAASDGGRAHCPDRQGTGTTLLLAGVGGELDPRFGPGSSAAHTATGARPLLGAWPSLRCDVDTEEDLAIATSLGLGPRTSDRLFAPRPCP
ncbi:2-phospho-L-lactate guanylyltransferase [Allokutzneria sp. A3M-2-11 16]|uniref:2-phospho-L-lactate guanylyltransferase n=1 Tax=Allokutzneria sp. A3M-2-11 16 TaxID=2962043 RepID=UPI0020B8C36F|nr:2-phospho-L-lactate guanylyltransferase [Allokutzneria sp. A3M-2-11 16]MCP3798069.1 2-phospho-L-lactate guanylyltransferase [Allokutzneria sp. A3M-2-11 16]